MSALVRLADTFDRALDRFAGWAGRQGPWRAGLLVALAAWGLSSLLYFQPTQFLPGYRPRWEEFCALCANPLERDVSRPMLQLRILTPALAWVLGLRDWWTLLIQYFALYANLVLVYVAMARRTRPETALLSTLLLALTFMTQWTNIFPGYPDSVSHAALAAALLTSRPWALAAWVATGVLNDERFVIGLPFVLLWQLRPASAETSWRALFRQGAGMAAGLLLALTVRHALKEGWIGPGMKADIYTQASQKGVAIGGLPFESTWPLFAFNVFMGLRWAWLVPLAALVLVKRRGHGLFLPGLAAALLLGTLATGMVLDVSRSLGYLFPAVLVGAAALERTQPERARNLLALALALCVLTPAYTFIGTRPFALWPPLYQLLSHYR